jgi:hypothetical protein
MLNGMQPLVAQHVTYPRMHPPTAAPISAADAAAHSQTAPTPNEKDDDNDDGDIDSDDEEENNDATIIANQQPTVIEAQLSTHA